MSDALMASPLPDLGEKARRRGSLGRVLERFRAVLRRRGGSKKFDSTTPIIPQSRQDDAPHVAVAEEAIGQPAQLSQFTRSTTNPPSTPRFGAPLEVDDADNSSILIADDPLQSPYAIADPTASLDERARILFAQYGLTYNPIKWTAQEPPRKMQRVEKPIRIRLRWSCHECKAALAQDKICVACGHRRCKECVKAPPSKVCQIMERTRKALETETGQGKSQSWTDSSRQPEAGRNVESAPVAASSLPVPTGNQAMIVYTLSPNGRGGVNMAHRLKATPVVERVYKKPRQRVRWTCDRCHSLFREREVCSNCDHARCEDCIRSPGKKLRTAPNATATTSLQTKLAASGTQSFEHSLVQSAA